MRFFLVLFIWSVAGSCLGQSIHAYKSVHADGTVEYSDTRPASASSVESVRVPAASASVDEQGRQRMEHLNAETERLDEQRAEQSKASREYQSRLAQARRELQDAERGLTVTRNSKKHATPERIAVAEQRVRLARQRLNEVQRAGP